jgi:hypothetical protein
MNKKYYIIGGIVLAIIIVIVIIYLVISNKSLKELIQSIKDKSSSITKPSQGSGYVSTGNDDFPLVKGSNGVRVKYLQAALNYYKSQKLVIDGDFGDNTLKALKSAYGISAVPESAYNISIKPFEGSLKTYMQFQGIII